MSGRPSGSTVRTSQGANWPSNNNSSNYGSVPFANATIMGIPWVLFCLLALSLGLIVSALFKTVSWITSYLGQRPKVVGPLVEEAVAAKAEQQLLQPSSPREIPVQPPPRPSSPPSSWRMATQALFPLPLLPVPEPAETGHSPLLPGAGEFRSSRSMPPTYVPTPFVGSSSHPNSPIHYYY